MDITSTHSIQMGGLATAGKVCPGCISESIRCRKLIFAISTRDILTLVGSVVVQLHGVTLI